MGVYLCIKRHNRENNVWPKCETSYLYNVVQPSGRRDGLHERDTDTNAQLFSPPFRAISIQKPLDVGLCAVKQMTHQ